MNFLNKGGLSLATVVNRWVAQPLLCSTRNYAARKGTRERKRKKIVKAEVKEKVGFIPHNLRNKDKDALNQNTKKYVPFNLREIPPDNVYVQKLYYWKVYSVAEAIQAHRETHHPTIYNQADAEVSVKIELNMQGEKITRFIEPFSRIASVPNKFNLGEKRNAVAFAKKKEDQDAALEAGVEVAGGVQLIKDIQNGKQSLEDFSFYLAHPDILAELVALRGLMKRKFPNANHGTLTPFLADAAKRFLNGVSYSAIRDEYEKDYGEVVTKIGTLSMSDVQLEENLESLLEDVYKSKPKRNGTFIDRVLILCPPSKEKFLIDHKLYVDIPAETENDDLEEDEEVEEEGLKEVVGQ